MSMTIKMYQVDAFSKGPFTGNPAAIVPLDQWLSNELMQNIAMENNLSETAFFVRQKDHYHIRWFTPTAEVKLCGHATLASAFVIVKYLHPKLDLVTFDSLSGELRVKCQEEQFQLDFPSDHIQEIQEPKGLAEALGTEVLETYQGDTDLLVKLVSEEHLRNLKPNFQALSTYGERGVIATAQGVSADFVSRCFYPRYGINEDPATGSAHTTLVPYWSRTLGKSELTAIQLSDRKGYLHCLQQDNRTLISGSAQLYLIGTIYV